MSDHQSALNRVLRRKSTRAEFDKLGLVGVTAEYTYGNHDDGNDNEYDNGHYTTTFSFCHKEYHPPGSTGYTPTLTIPWAIYPGCCGIKIVHEISLSGQFIQPDPVEGNPHRRIYTSTYRRGITTALFRVFVKALKVQKTCGLLVGAITDQQSSGRAWAESFGWTPVGVPFRNPNTSNVIQSYEYRLTSKRYDEHVPRGIF